MFKIISYLALVFLTSTVFSCKKSSDILPPSGSGNGNVKTAPTVSTTDTSNLTLYSVNTGGKIINSGSSTVTEQGIVVGSSPSPTITNNLKKNSLPKDASNSFSIKLRALSSNTTYYVRAYAISADGVGYGNEIKFTSPIEKRFYGQQILFNQQDVIDFAQLGYNTVSSLLIQGYVTDLSPLKNLVIVYQQLEILGGNSLNSLHGLHNLEFSGTFKMTYNTSLHDLSGLNNLEFIKGDVQIINNSGLTSLNGINNVSLIGGFGRLWIKDCDNIQNLTGLENLQLVDNDIHILNNKNLSDLTALRKLETVYGDINIRDNQALISLNGFEKLHFAEDILLENNLILQDIGGLNNIDTLDLTYGGGIYIIGNPSLLSISSFKNITTVNTVSILSNNALSNFQGFNKLKKVNTLFIENNSILSNLGGLENLRIAQSIAIKQNATLSNFCSLKPLFISGYTNPFITQGNALNPTSTYILNNCP